MILLGYLSSNFFTHSEVAIRNNIAMCLYYVYIFLSYTIPLVYNGQSRFNSKKTSSKNVTELFEILYAKFTTT